MNRVTPQIREAARRLLRHEVDAGNAALRDGTAAFRVCEKLRLPLSTLAGATGSRALLARAVALAGTEVRWLKGVHVAADGSLEGIEKIEAQLSQSEIAEGEMVLIAALLMLLLTFIGEALMLRLVRDAWPKAALDDLNFDLGKNR